MPYEYNRPEAIEHILQAMQFVISMIDGIDSSAPEAQMISSTYRRLEHELMIVVQTYTRPNNIVDPNTASGCGVTVNGQ